MYIYKYIIYIYIYIYSSFGIYKSRYHNDSYLLLRGKRKLQSFEI